MRECKNTVRCNYWKEVGRLIRLAWLASHFVSSLHLSIYIFNLNLNHSFLFLISDSNGN